MNLEEKNRMPLKLAVLLVNGIYNYKERLWIELSIGNIIKHMSPCTNFKIFVWNHDRRNLHVLSYLESVKDFVEVLSEDNFDLKRWAGTQTNVPPSRPDYFAGGYHVHRAPLQILFEQATEKYGAEIIFTSDSDSWPFRDNWEIPLVYHLQKDIKLAGVWRDELRAVIPPYVHSSGLGIRADTVTALNLRFDHEPLPPTEDTLSRFTQAVLDRFGTEALWPWRRSNRKEYHSVFNGVYGGFIYHHHLGTRYRDGRIKEPRTYGWEERGESLNHNKFILDSTTPMVFSNADDFICDLLYGEAAFRLKMYSGYLRNVNTQEAYDCLFEKAWALKADSPAEAYFIAGLIGKRLALDREFLSFYADLCERLDYAREAEAYHHLASLPVGGLVEQGRERRPPSGDPCDEESLGLDKKPGDPHYRAYVGPPKEYDLIAAMTFNLLTTIGLRQHHRLLDIGCGSLRVGRLLIPYLNAGGYVGIEPERWLVEEGLRKEVGADLIRIKKPQFLFGNNPQAVPEGQMFDFAVAQSVFSHSTLDVIDRWLIGIFPHLRPNGALLATFRPGDQDFFHEDGISEKDFQGKDWVYPKCPTYRPETIKNLALKAGFRFQMLDWRHPRQVWALLAREDFDSSWFESNSLTWNSYIEEVVLKKKGPSQ